MGRLDNAGLAWVHSHPAVTRNQGPGAVTEGPGASATVAERTERPCYSRRATSVGGPSAASSRPPDPVVPPAGTGVRVRGLRGDWTVRGRGADGSVTLTGGQSGQWRSVTAGRLVDPGRTRARRAAGPAPVSAAEPADSPTI